MRHVVGLAIVTWFGVCVAPSVARGQSTVNVKDFGAIGANIETVGSMRSGLPFVTVASLAAWKIGAGVGIQGAGPGGRALRARILGLQLPQRRMYLDAQASTTVRGAVVQNDDSVPIQAAIDALASAGGICLIPAGEYRIGVAKAYAADAGAVINQPIKVRSNTSIRGAGIGATTLKLANDVRQGAPNALAFLTHVWNGVNVYKSNCAIFVNDYHDNFYTGVPPAGTTHDVELCCMTLDGNKEFQPTQYQRGTGMGSTAPAVRNGSCNVIDDGEMGNLTSGQHYGVSYSYLDSQGRETNSSGASPVALGAHQTSIRAQIPPTPAGVSQIYLYITNIDDPAFVAAVNFAPTWKYERRGPFAVPASNDFPITVAPTAPTNTVDNPGNTPGLLLNAPGNNGASVINLHRVENWYIHDIEARQTVLEGLDCTGSDHIQVERCWFHHNGRDGAAITGASTFHNYVDCRFEDAESAAFDIEPGEGDDLAHIHFVRCSFVGNWGPAVALGLGGENSLASDFLFDSCLFDRNFRGLQMTVSGHPARPSTHVTNVIVSKCTFKNQLSTSVTWAYDGSGSISECLFDGDGERTFVSPDYSVIAARGCVTFLSAAENWVITHNRFKGYENATGVYFADPGARNCQIVDNVHDSTVGDTSVFLGFAGSSGSCIVKNNSTSSSTGLGQVDESNGLRRRAFQVTDTFTADARSTTKTIVLSREMLNADYTVTVDWDGFDPGAWWIASGRTSTGFTLNWSNAATGTEHVTWMVRL